MGAKNVYFWSENSDSAVFRWPMRGNEEELWEHWYNHSPRAYDKKCHHRIHPKKWRQ